MAPAEGRVAMSERRWDCRRGTPKLQTTHALRNKKKLYNLQSSLFSRGDWLPVAQLIRLPLRQPGFLVCIVISFIMFVVHGRISVWNDLFVQLGSFCFSLYEVTFEQIKMNENESRHVELRWICAQPVHRHANGCRRTNCLWHIPPWAVQLAPVGVDNGASWSVERLREWLAECSALDILRQNTQRFGWRWIGSQ